MWTVQQRVFLPFTVHVGFIDRHVVVRAQVRVFVVREARVEAQGATEGAGLGVVPEPLTDGSPQTVYRHLHAAIVRRSTRQPEVNAYR